MNYYLLLGIPQDADADMIRSAFRALDRRYHPDAGEGSSAEKFRDILVAYETLNDPTRRKAYDRIMPRTRRAPKVSIAEPLMARAVPEPMLDPKRRFGRANRAIEVPRRLRLNELIDELLQSWDELFVDAPQRRRRI